MIFTIEENCYKSKGNGANGCGGSQLFTDMFIRLTDAGDYVSPMSCVGTTFDGMGKIIIRGRHDDMVPKPGETFQYKTWREYGSGLKVEGEFTIPPKPDVSRG